MSNPVTVVDEEADLCACKNTGNAPYWDDLKIMAV